MIDLQTVKESYKNKEIGLVSFVSSEHNIADAMKKVNTYSTLMNALRFSNLTHPIQQWIIRKEQKERPETFKDDSVDKTGNVDDTVDSQTPEM